MPISIVIGGQFGSEGKGKVSYYFANKFNAVAVVRVGGTNSGHTVISGAGKEYVFRILPTSSIDKNKLSILPSGSYIDLQILHSEIEMSGIMKDNLKIDPYSVIIDKFMKDSEAQISLMDKIGSTQSGTGAAVIGRLSRTENVIFAKDCADLAPFITDTKGLMRSLLNENQHIVIEGTQGFGLSPINSNYYPYCTSRDTTAAGFLMEAGLSPFDVANVIMVIRSYPIRVGGNSGPLPSEIDWDTIAKRSGATIDLKEFTSATKRIRRVAEFDADVVKKAISVNMPNIVALNHLDYVDYNCHDSEHLSDTTYAFIKSIQDMICHSIDYVGTGKSTLFSIGAGRI